MFGWKGNPNGGWWALALLFVMNTCLFVVLCFEPCPETARGLQATKLPKIREEDVEKAFLKAEKRIQKRRHLEWKLMKKGRVIERSAITAESNHQPISGATPIVRERESQQLLFEEASAILTEKFHLTSAQVSCGLPDLPLKGPAARRALETCKDDETANIKCNKHAKYRTADGSCNNLKNPTWGISLACVNRLLLPDYIEHSDFRQSKSKGYLPSPRKLSLKVHTNLNKTTTNVNHMYMFFGQLLDHDLTATSQSTTEDWQTIQCCPLINNDHPQCAPITMSDDDPFYSTIGKTCFNFVRAASCRYCKLGPRCQIDAVTPFIDASFAYGNSFAEVNLSRTHDGTGTMRMQDTGVGDLLPRSSDLSTDRCSRPKKNQICFQSGDARVNQHPLLTSLHTLFHREHNRVARILHSLNPTWDGETIFQEARKVVGAEMQVVTYKEYLPVTLGKDRMSLYDLNMGNRNVTYNPDLDPTMFTEFSTAAFRFGHSMINSMIREDPITPGHTGHLLRDTFMNPFGLYDGEMDVMLRGVTRSPSNCFGRHMVPDVTNHLYRVKGSHAGLDLAAINIQRGRDNGLQAYTAYVRFCSQRKRAVKNFDDLSRRQLMTPESVSVLQRLYKSVHDIDLFTGLLSEIQIEGAQVGPTTACILGLQFQRLKFGDRFYFELTGQPGSFTKAQTLELQKTSLAKIICDNTKITEMQEQAMILPHTSNTILPCSQIPGINLTVWKKSS